MAHHAYFIAAETEQGIQASLEFVERELGLSPHENPDVVTLRHGLLSVEDARALRDLSELAATNGGGKAIIVSAGRLFHEAQNALLKLFEEPPADTTLILVIPAEGMLLPTLRSRLLALPTQTAIQSSGIAAEFLGANSAAREKLVAKLLDRAKSDKDAEKQEARLQSIRLVEGLMRVAHEKWQSEKNPQKQAPLQQFLADLQQFLPILHERSAPLKLVFEHIQLTTPL